MRKRVLLGVAVVGCMMVSNCFAQAVPELKSENASAQTGEVKTIFSFKKEIGLTDEQESKIKALLYDDQSLMNTSRSTLNARGTELGQLIKDKANMKLIKSKLEEISKIQVEMTCKDIENSRKIDSILTPVQIEKWKAIKEKALAESKK
jgi:Spy/CpxP family protein refolding chaperone